MIIQLRGTSGSGKTWAANKVMGELGAATPVFMTGRKRPILYMFESQRIAVLGSYETACGGCDTISDTNFTFNLIKALTKRGFQVMFEGLLLSADVQRVLDLHKRFPGQYVGLTLSTSVERCLEQVNARRRKRLGEEFTPVKEENTRSKHRGVHSTHAKLLALGLDMRLVSSKDAAQLITSALLCPF